MSDSKSKLVLWFSDVLKITSLAIVLGLLFGALGEWLELDRFPVIVVSSVVIGVVVGALVGRRRGQGKE